MALETREVEVRGTKYMFVLTPAIKALKGLQRITGKMSGLIPNLIARNSDKVNEDFFNLITEEYDELFKTFIDINQLKYKDKTDWKLINDFDEHFSGQCTAPVELLYKIIIENDKSFFHSLPTLINKGLKKLNENLQANSLQMPEGFGQTMETVANSLKESLG
jgi:hypothetical protein